MERLQRLENLRKKRERRQRDGMSSCECGSGSSELDAAMRARRQSFEEEQKYDPIMMTPLQPITFKFKRPNGKIIRFNVDSLCDYLLATGDFNDPESRLPFLDEDLQRLDELAAKLGLGKASTLEAKNDAQRYAEMRLRRDGLVGLERCVGELIIEIMAVVEGEACDEDEGQMRLIASLFPMFGDLYQQLCFLDAEVAKHTLLQYIEYIQGPPNKPTVDAYGFKPIVLSYLRGLARGDNGGFGGHGYGY
jgi:hypothetical protein